ncbi:hypothetical protein MVEG_01085 [Podila verticillata NRRL 6337]|nr:hypothetical protein MVEG_01085 [Podila verticillata NRRL 6337]
MAAYSRNKIDLLATATDADHRVMYGKDPISYHQSPYSPRPPPLQPPRATTLTTATITSNPHRLIHSSRTITAPTSSYPSKTQDIDEDELEVIGSGISDVYQRDKAIPLVLPNLKYDHPETVVQNYSPGTSLVFNAYKGHAALLTQPYHAQDDAVDDGSGYRDVRMIQSPGSSEHRDRPYRPQHDPHDYSYPRRQSNYLDYHDELERPGRYSSPERMDRELVARERGPDRPPQEYYHPRPPHPHPYPHSRSPHPYPHMYHEQEYPVEGSQHNYNNNSSSNSNNTNNNSHYNARSDPYHTRNDGPWTPEHRPSYSAAIDIPQPNRSFPPNLNRPNSGGGNHRDLDRTQHHPNQPYDRPSAHTMPPGSRGSPTGPHYALSQVNYRLIYEYAREVHDCLIKGKVGSTDRLLYNAEILSKVFMGCRVDQDPAEIVEEETAINPHQPRCASCNIVKTPEWRKGPLGPRTLCNACGLIWGKMSRSKAALAKAAKQQGEETKDDAPPEMSEAPESQSCVLDDAHMSDISPTQQLDSDKDPMEVSRKRPRDPTPVEPEIDELEDDSSMEGDVNIKEDITIPVEELHISSSARSVPPPPSSSASAATSVSPKTPSQANASTSMHQRQHQHLLPHEAPSSAMILGEESAVSGKKLTLSYLLG